MQDQQRYYVEVGQRIRAARQARSITQFALAEAVSLTRTSITNIEHGRQKFPMHLLPQFAGVLHVPVSALLPSEQIEDEDLNEALEGRSVEEQAWIRSTLFASPGSGQ